MEIVPLGDRSILLNFRQTIDPETHKEVMIMCRKLTDASIPAISFIMPAYCSITLGYDPKQSPYQKLITKIKAIGSQKNISTYKAHRSLTIPVCYEDPYALDLLEISRQRGVNPGDIVEEHAGHIYMVYMLGFLPGFPYMGILPEAIQFPRRSTPRIRVPERSVGIAGSQTGIYPYESPGGWQIIGNTPLPMLISRQTSSFFFKAGDEVTFQSITKSEYQKIEEEIENDVFNWDSVYD